jgi:hypothetical protein
MQFFLFLLLTGCCSCLCAALTCDLGAPLFKDGFFSDALHAVKGSRLTRWQLVGINSKTSFFMCTEKSVCQVDRNKGNVTCLKHTAGVLCGSCSRGYANVDGRCETCPPFARNGWQLVVLSFGAVCLAGGYHFRSQLSERSNAYLHGLRRCSLWGRTESLTGSSSEPNPWLNLFWCAVRCGCPCARCQRNTSDKEPLLARQRAQSKKRLRDSVLIKIRCVLSFFQIAGLYWTNDQCARL